MKPKIDPKKLKKYWDSLRALEDYLNRCLCDLEDEMKQEFQIEDMEFFWADNQVVGISTGDTKIGLIHRPR